MLFFLCPLRLGLGLGQHLQHLHQLRVPEHQSQLCRINTGSSHLLQVGLMLGFSALKGFRTFSRVECCFSSNNEQIVNLGLEARFGH